MQVTAIVAEYNTFHNGHKYHIEETWKKTDNSFIMAIMSGNFVQRGEPAILKKRKRAEIAIKNGVDLVVELPTPWATASAERFARGAVYIAHQAVYLKEAFPGRIVLFTPSLYCLLPDRPIYRETDSLQDISLPNIQTAHTA